MATTFSYDIGIASIGSAVEKDNKLVYMGTRVFNEAISAKEARLNRSSRRTTRRKTWRKNQMKEAFIDFGVIDEKDFKSTFANVSNLTIKFWSGTLEDFLKWENYIEISFDEVLKG